MLHKPVLFDSGNDDGKPPFQLELKVTSPNEPIHLLAGKMGE
jgi:hypothetical protein